MKILFSQHFRKSTSHGHRQMLSLFCLAFTASIFSCCLFLGHSVLRSVTVKCALLGWHQATGLVIEDTGFGEKVPNTIPFVAVNEYYLINDNSIIMSSNKVRLLRCHVTVTLQVNPVIKA